MDDELPRGLDKRPVYLAVNVNEEHEEGWEDAPVCDDAPDGRTMPVVDSRAIQTAVRLLYPGEVAKHAVSEGTKATTRYVDKSSRDNRPKGEATPELMGPYAGLQFRPARVIAYAQSLPGCRCILTETAAVYLAAVLEYTVAELLELGGNVCRDRDRRRKPSSCIETVSYTHLTLPTICSV